MSEELSNIPLNPTDSKNHRNKKTDSINVDIKLTAKPHETPGPKQPQIDQARAIEPITRPRPNPDESNQEGQITPARAKRKPRKPRKPTTKSSKPSTSTPNTIPTEISNSTNPTPQEAEASDNKVPNAPKIRSRARTRFRKKRIVEDIQKNDVDHSQYVSNQLADSSKRFRPPALLSATIMSYNNDMELRALRGLFFMEDAVDESESTYTIPIDLAPLDLAVDIISCLDGMKIVFTPKSSWKTDGALDPSDIVVVCHNVYYARALTSWLQTSVTKVPVTKPMKLYESIKLLFASLDDAIDHASTTIIEELSNIWTENEHERLEKALVYYKSCKDPIEKWKSIAQFVSTKSAKQCFTRYKDCHEQIQKDSANLEKMSESSDSSENPVVLDPNPNPNAGITLRNSNNNASSSEANFTNLHDDLAPESRETPSAASYYSSNRVYSESKSLYQVISYRGLTGSGIAYLYTSILQCVMICGRCNHRDSVSINLGDPSSHFHRNSTKTGCTKCNRMMQVDCQNLICEPNHDPSTAYIRIPGFTIILCNVLRVTTSCNTCTTFNSLPIANNHGGSLTCFKCYNRSSLNFSDIAITGSQLMNVTDKDSKAASTAIMNKITSGKPLPKMGACKHYGKSLRWFIWPCCNVPYPCDKCHDKSTTHACPEMAHRIVCGLCSKVQNSSTKQCSCGNLFSSTAKTFWEGGKGCRDLNRLSKKDKRKYRGLTKQ